MAQPVNFRFQYLGAIEAKAGEEYAASDIIADSKFTNATAFMLKTDQTRKDPVKVSINKTPQFPIYLNEISAFDGTASLTYVFNKDCIIAILQDLDVTP